ncbi:MAG TPA: SCO family protein [Puia sp.]|nr:SCO family protein [Puia sp.]
MKTIFALFIPAISVIVLSCHRKQLVTSRISCCPPARTAVAAETERPAVPTETSLPAVAAETVLLPEAPSSIYQLPGKWTDEHNHGIELSQLKGKVQVMAMIFTHCAYACPRLVQDMKAIEDSLSGSEKNNVGFVLVSFDSQRDDPAQLRRFASEQGLDDHWTLLHGDPGQVRELSMLLNIKYQDAGDNNYSHSNAILILDKQGTVTRSLEGLQPQTALAGEVINQLVNR